MTSRRQAFINATLPPFLWREIIPLVDVYSLPGLAVVMKRFNVAESILFDRLIKPLLVANKSNLVSTCLDLIDALADKETLISSDDISFQMYPRLIMIASNSEIVIDFGGKVEQIDIHLLVQVNKISGRDKPRIVNVSFPSIDRLSGKQHAKRINLTGASMQNNNLSGITVHMMRVDHIAFKNISLPEGNPASKSNIGLLSFTDCVVNEFYSASGYPSSGYSTFSNCIMVDGYFDTRCEITKCTLTECHIDLLRKPDCTTVRYTDNTYNGCEVRRSWIGAEKYLEKILEMQTTYLDLEDHNYVNLDTIITLVSEMALPNTDHQDYDRFVNTRTGKLENLIERAMDIGATASWCDHNNYFYLSQVIKKCWYLAYDLLCDKREETLVSLNKMIQLYTGPVHPRSVFEYTNQSLFHAKQLPEMLQCNAVSLPSTEEMQERLLKFISETPDLVNKNGVALRALRSLTEIRCSITGSAISAVMVTTINQLLVSCGSWDKWVLDHYRFANINIVVCSREPLGESVNQFVDLMGFENQGVIQVHRTVRVKIGKDLFGMNKQAVLRRLNEFDAGKGIRDQMRSLYSSLAPLARAQLSGCASDLYSAGGIRIPKLDLGDIIITKTNNYISAYETSYMISVKYPGLRTLEFTSSKRLEGTVLKFHPAPACAYIELNQNRKVLGEIRFSVSIPALIYYTTGRCAPYREAYYRFGENGHTKVIDRESNRLGSKLISRGFLL